MSETEATPPSDFMSTRKAAASLGVALSTVQLWVETGILPAWKTAGGHRRIPRSAVELMASKQKSVLSPPPTENIKVLVVEDDMFLLELYRRKFAEWALPVQLLTATDGFEGLMLIGRDNPSLIITDLRMPGMDGFKMIRHLREQTLASGFDIIVVTAMEAAEIEQAGNELPGIPIYPKPVPFIILRALIENKIQSLQLHKPL